MAKRKQEAAKPRKAKTKPEPETIEVKPHTRKAPAKKPTRLGTGLNEIEQGKRPGKRKPAVKAQETVESNEPEALDPEDETDVEISRLEGELVANETRRMQRVKKLSHTRVRAALRETAGILVQSAELLGVSRSALYQYIKRNDLEQELEDIRDDILDQAEAAVKLAIMGGNIGVAQWYLTKMGHKRGYAERHTVQQVGANGQPIDPRETILAYRPVLSPDAPPPANPVL